MSTLRIEYPDAGAAAGPAPANHRDGKQPRRFLARVVRWSVTAVLLAVLPFILLVRGGVFAYHQWGLGAWSSLAVSTAATALLLACYALGRKSAPRGREVDTADHLHVSLRLPE